MKNLSRYEKFEKLIEFIHENKCLPRREKDTDLYMVYSSLQQSAKLAKEKQIKGKKLGNIAQENLFNYNQIMETLRLYKPSKIEKLELLIKFIHENHRLPKNKKDSNSISEDSYKDGSDMRAFYDGFMSQVKKLKEKQKDGIPLKEKELIYLEYGKIIEEEVEKYKITIEEKVEQLIEFINKNHRLPRAKQFNNGKVEVKYRDNTSMSIFQLWIYSEAKRIEEKQKNGELLTKEEQEILYFRSKIEEALKSQKMTRQEKVEELINFIEEKHRLPKFKYYNNNESEALFRDGTDMRNFYHVLMHKANEIDEKVKNKEILTEDEQKELDSFYQLQEILLSFKIKKEEKFEQLLEFVVKNHRLPRVEEVTYDDGTDMNKFYSRISNGRKLAIEKEKQGIPLTIKQQQNKNYYEKMHLVLNFYKQNKNSEIERIMEYLEKLRKESRQEEIILFCEVMIENKNLNEEEQENLRQVFNRYVEHIQVLEKEKMKIKEY